MATSRKSIGRKSSGQTLSVEDFRARTLASPVKAQGLQESEADCGQSSQGALAILDLSTSLWRTSQPCLFGGWVQFCEIWPRSGTMRSDTAIPCGNDPTTPSVVRGEIKLRAGPLMRATLLAYKVIAQCPSSGSWNMKQWRRIQRRLTRHFLGSSKP